MNQLTTAASDPDLDWVLHMERGLDELHTTGPTAAKQSWRQAGRLAEQFDDDDPRRAAYLNNLAVAAHLGGRLADADRLYRLALQTWTASWRWIDGMRLGPRARSSLFHMRLESAHRDHYDRLALREYRALLPAGRAVVLSNQAQWRWFTGDRSGARSLSAMALDERQAAFGASERGAAIMRDNRAIADDDPDAKAAALLSSCTVWAPVLAEPFTRCAERQGWIVDRPPEFTDEGRLMAAIHCAGLIVRAGHAAQAR